LSQTRRRIFIVGIRSDLGIRYEFPIPTHGPDGSNPYMTQLDALGSMPEWPEWPEGEYCTEPFHWYYLSRRRRHDWNEQSPCVVGHWRHVPIHPLSPPLVRINTDNWRFSHAGPTRRISFRESASLQGFDDSYKWDQANVKEAFLASGNAVPKQLLRAIAEALPNVW
jgi:DNA (cytosine-5)-methyltransferase 1